MQDNLINYLAALLLSALIINGVHGYLLVSQKTKRRFTISEHAALHKRSFAIYIVGHLLGGLFFLIFAKQFYLDIQDLPWLLGLSILAVFFEYLQAFIPAKGKTNGLHTVLALIMWMLIITIGLLSIIFVPSHTAIKFFATLLYAGLFFSLFYAYRNREKIYIHQMIMVGLFYLCMVILAL